MATMRKRPRVPSLSSRQLRQVVGGGGLVRLIKGSEADPPPEPDFRTIALAD